MKANSPRKEEESNKLVIDFARVVFLDRIQTQEEINRLIEEVFGDKKRMSPEEF